MDLDVGDCIIIFPYSFIDKLPMDVVNRSTHTQKINLEFKQRGKRHKSLLPLYGFKKSQYTSFRVKSLFRIL
jgi:hypothetical protein